MERPCPKNSCPDSRGRGHAQKSHAQTAMEEAMPASSARACPAQGLRVTKSHSEGASPLSKFALVSEGGQLQGGRVLCASPGPLLFTRCAGGSGLLGACSSRLLWAPTAHPTPPQPDSALAHPQPTPPHPNPCICLPPAPSSSVLLRNPTPPHPTPTLAPAGVDRAGQEGGAGQGPELERAQQPDLAPGSGLMAI